MVVLKNIFSLIVGFVAAIGTAIAAFIFLFFFGSFLERLGFRMHNPTPFLLATQLVIVFLGVWFGKKVNSTIVFRKDVITTASIGFAIGFGLITYFWIGLGTLKFPA